MNVVNKIVFNMWIGKPLQLLEGVWNSLKNDIREFALNSLLSKTIMSKSNGHGLPPTVRNVKGVRFNGDIIFKKAWYKIVIANFTTPGESHLYGLPLSLCRLLRPLRPFFVL